MTTDNDPTLKDELEFFESVKDSLLETHADQFALVSGRELIGIYTTEEQAYQAGLDRLGNKPFLIRQIRKEEPRLQAPVIFVGMNRGPDQQ